MIVLPSKDIELEVHRGLGGRSIFVKRWVIPASTVSAVIINEGLYGWNVRYYLAILTKTGETQSLHVLFEVKGSRCARRLQLEIFAEPTPPDARPPRRIS